MRLLDRFFGPCTDAADKPLYLSVDDADADRLVELLQDPSLRRKLEKYFEKLRAAYPDGVITRLNTGHKKLAERGAQLRHRLGMEGDLDGFFALGGFEYRRSAGGRPSPSLSPEARDRLLRELSQAFPDGIPTLSAVQDRDHRLYLNLRTVARKQACTMTEFLRRHGLMRPKESGEHPDTAQKGVILDGIQ